MKRKTKIAIVTTLLMTSGLVFSVKQALATDGNDHKEVLDTYCCKDFSTSAYSWDCITGEGPCHDQACPPEMSESANPCYL